MDSNHGSKALSPKSSPAVYRVHSQSPKTGPRTDRIHQTPLHSEPKSPEMRPPGTNTPPPAPPPPPTGPPQPPQRKAARGPRRNRPVHRNHVELPLPPRYLMTSSPSKSRDTPKGSDPTRPQQPRQPRLDPPTAPREKGRRKPMNNGEIAGSGAPTPKGHTPKNPSPPHKDAQQTLPPPSPAPKLRNRTPYAPKNSHRGWSSITRQGWASRGTTASPHLSVPSTPGTPLVPVSHNL